MSQRQTSSAIRVAIADDSVFIRKAVARMLSADPAVEVVGAAASGEELLDRLAEWRPDVVTLDLSMPGMGGLTALDRIMRERPVPVIILSSFSKAGAPVTIEALHRGAVDFVDKGRYSLLDFESLGELLLEKVREVAGSTVRPVAAVRPVPAAPVPAVGRGEYDVVLIGASTGGPVAVQRVLTDLGPDLTVPVLVAQHMPEGFTYAFAERLNTHLPLAVREAGDGEAVLPGTVYIARAGSHLRLESRVGRLSSRVSSEPDDAPHRPSVDVLFASARRAVAGRAVALVLTGMGKDGAAGLAELAAAGAYTLAQDSETSVVYGMPRAAAAAGAVREQLALDRIGGRIRELLRLPG